MAGLGRDRGCPRSIGFVRKERQLLCAGMGTAGCTQWCFTSPCFTLERLVQGFQVQGARSRSLLPAGRQQPVVALQTKHLCLRCCRARRGAGLPLLHETLSQPQHSSLATWQPSWQESNQLRSQGMPGWGDRGASRGGPRVPGSL